MIKSQQRHLHTHKKVQKIQVKTQIIRQQSLRCTALLRVICFFPLFSFWANFPDFYAAFTFFPLGSCGAHCTVDFFCQFNSRLSNIPQTCRVVWVNENAKLLLQFMEVNRFLRSARLLLYVRLYARTQTGLISFVIYTASKAKGLLCVFISKAPNEILKVQALSN